MAVVKGQEILHLTKCRNMNQQDPTDHKCFLDLLSNTEPNTESNTQLKEVTSTAMGIKGGAS